MSPRQGAIYVTDEGGNLTPFLCESYDNELNLQKLIAENPSLLGGDQIDSDDERRWILVRREQTINDAETKAGRWSLDHLFLDQDGIPTFVEVKRASDTRIRREVVGQMLDYAANAVAYWSAQHIRESLGSSGIDPDTAVEEFSGKGANEFWRDVQHNLESRRVRLMFVADHIPHELRRIIEYLNEQMVTDVLGVEVRKYVADAKQAYIPYVIGNTAKALDRKSGGVPLNYQGKLNFEEVMKLCNERGDDIVIGYNGGLAKLSNASLKELQARGAYKWDLAEGGIGTKYGKNWLKGGEFFKIVSGKQSTASSCLTA